MGSFTDKFKRHRQQFIDMHDPNDYALNYYAPHFFKRLGSQLKAKGINLSQETLEEVCSKSSIKYIVIFDYLHRAMHEMHTPDENDMNPKEKRYHELQYAESLTWVMIKIADDIIDKHNPENDKVTTQEVEQFMNAAVFNSDGKMPELKVSNAKKEALTAIGACLAEELKNLNATEEFREVIGKLGASWHKEALCTNMEEFKEAKHNISIESANTSLFFILGANDKVYADRHFPDKEKIKQNLQSLAVTGDYFDNFVDFNKDKQGPTKNLNPTLNDRIKFLVAGVCELAKNIPAYDMKQASYVSGLISKPLTYKLKEIIQSSDKKSRKYDQIIDNCRNILVGELATRSL